MTNMKPRMKLLAGALTLLILLVTFCSAVAADQKNEEVLSVEITLSQGNKKILNPPLRMSGRFEAKDFTFTNLSLERVVSIVLDKKGSGRSVYLLTLAGRDEPISVTIDEKAEISGSGEWGKERISLTKIESLAVSTPKTLSSFEPKTKWVCTLTSGEEIVIGWSSEWHRGRAFAGQIGNASLQLNAEEVTEIERDSNTWTMLSGDRFRLQGWKPKQNSFETSSQFGEIELPWANVSKLSSRRSSTQGSKKAQDTKPAAYQWHIEIAGRFLLPITEIETGSKNTINDELIVKNINWDFIDTGNPDPSGLELHLANKKSWVLQGTLTAKSPFGTMFADCKDITEFKRVAPVPKSRTPSDYDKRIIATAITKSGAEYPVGAPSLEGGDKVTNDKDFFGYGLFRIPASPVEMWVSSELLLSSRLSIVEGKFSSDSPRLERYGLFGGFTGIEFINPVGQFELPLSKLVQYYPQASPSDSKTPKNLAARYSIIVKDDAGKEFTGELVDMEFARYPARGWVGSYSKGNYPFQWHMANVLYFKKESGERIDVEFDKLKTIQIHDTYNSNRPAILTSRQGMQMKGSIYPGDVTKSYPGTSDWDSAKEGLLCRMTDGTYVYIPFSKGKTVEIQQVTPKIEKRASNSLHK